MSTRWSSQILSYSVRGLAMACGPVGRWMDCALFSARSGPKKGDGARQGRARRRKRSAQVAQSQLRLGDAFGERLGVERLRALGLAPDAADAKRRETVRVVGLGEREDRARVAGGGGAAEEEPGAGNVAEAQELGGANRQPLQLRGREDDAFGRRSRRWRPSGSSRRGGRRHLQGDRGRDRRRQGRRGGKWGNRRRGLSRRDGWGGR